MSTLLLARHGQAAAFEADSDRLTSLGHLQAKKLGEFLARENWVFDEAVMGSLKRHAETASGVIAAYREAGVPFPEPRVVPGWNEYDATGITSMLMPELTKTDAGFASLVTAFQEAASSPGERNRHFQRAFEVLMDRWIKGEVAADGVETFAAFHERVSRARAEVLDDAQSRRVIVFTSGGPIGVCVQRTLDAPARMALQVNWRVKNASLTEFLFSRGRVSLDGFNQVAHLAEAERSFR